MRKTVARHPLGAGKHRACVILLVAAVLACLPALAVEANSGTIIYVDIDTPGTVPDGNSWGTAYIDLQTALGVANSGDEIWVAEGTYTPGTARTDTFQLETGVAVYGGFVGTEVEGEGRKGSFDKTILSGDIGVKDDSSDNSYHVVTGSGTDATAVLDGFTVTGGNADGGSYHHYSGSGMYNSSGSPTVENCTFSGNEAFYGGGMYNWSNSSPTVENCTFSGNAAYYGGGMYNWDNSDPTVTNCTFSGNEAFYGGGMYNWIDSSPTVENCTFSGNEAERNGGGMYNRDSSSPTVRNCTFSGNEAGFGGGMYNEASSSPTVENCTFSDNEAHLGGGIGNANSSPTVANCTFFDNVAETYGGGMCNWIDSSPTVENCTFSDNEAWYYGGGMYNRIDSSPTLQNCTFSGNVAWYYGGGMYNANSSPTVQNCTFSDNEAYLGGGMYNRASSPTVTNTILAGNTPDDCDGSVASDGYNLESGTSCGCSKDTDQQNADPLLGDLQDNGGPTETHALLPGSPALDAIPSPSDYNGAPPTDQRGLPRPYPAGGLADIGAVEMQLAYANGDVNSDGVIDLLDVRLCAQIAQGYITGTPSQRAAADVDGDGDVDADDVTILSEYVLGARPTLP